jgi:ribosome-binding protein aMBF1 (putative translation factor)
MSTSQNLSVLSEIHGDDPIPLKTRRYFRRLLQNRIHELVLQAFMDQEEREGLTQKQLAGRIEKAPEQINRWLHTAGNWEIDTLADLLLGMKVRLNELSATRMADLVERSPKPSKSGEASPEAVPVRSDPSAE